MSSFLISILVAMLVTAPPWIPEYKRWKFDKYVDKNYSAYGFKCPSCSAKSDKIKIINFDNCCHNFKIYGINNELYARDYAGSKVVCLKCGQIMHVLYFTDDLEENNIFYLQKLLLEKPKKPGEFPPSSV